jgi:serine/threonine protein kinase/Tol biopolymer transport system component
MPHPADGKVHTPRRFVRGRIEQIIMSLASGARLGPYEIVGSIGAGGMGEVFRARDTRLKRDVALKVLPDSFASDPDRVRRFQLEAQAASALNHPNILVVHDIGHEPAAYLVSELLEGQSLREKLREGKLPVSKAIDIARQTAAGLAAAHSKGITHRDIKPENLFLTKDGRVKILDFGLAKVTTSEKPSADNVTETQVTDPGAVLGTASYMSPEQVRAKPVDQRSDIFSLGCVLYEMLGGKRPFRGDTAADTMSAILKQDPPDLTSLDHTLPPALDRIVRHCLEKNPDDRFQSARDLAFDLESLSQTSQSAPAEGRTPPGQTTRRAALGVLAAAVPLAAAGGVLLGRRWTNSPALKFHRLTYRRGKIQAARFAPDGHTIVYSAQWEDQPYQLFTVRDDGPESRPLGFPGAGVFGISSRSELALGLNLRSTTFYNRGTLARAPFSGGEPRPMLNDVRFADWTADGADLAVIVETTKGWQIQLPPGQLLYQGSSAGFLGDLRFSPDGSHIAFLEHPTTNSDGSVAVVDRNGQKKLLSRWYSSNIQGLAWSPKGDEIWFTGTTGGARNELRAVTLAGRERLISSEVAQLVLQDIARDGRVLVAAGLEFRARIFYRGPGDAREREVSGLDWSLVRDISADGKLITFDESGEGAGGTGFAYIRDVNAPAGVKLGPGRVPVLSLDQKWVLTSATDGQSLAIYPVDVGETRHIPLEGFRVRNAFFHPNGQEIILFASEPGHGSRIYRMSIAGGRPRPISAEGVTAVGGCFVSVDGKYIPGISVSDRRLRLYPLEGGDPREVAGITPDDRVSGWVPGGNDLFVIRTSELPAKLMRLNYETGKRELVREIAPSDRAGVSSGFGIVVTPDAKAYAYSVVQMLHELHLVEGLR